MKIITVTLNPSLDRAVVLHYLNLGYHNRVKEATRLDPGGRGVNVSRALHRLGCETTGVVLVGNDATGRAYRALIAQEGFPVKLVTTPGRTRSNMTIVDTGNKAQTHLIEEAIIGDEKVTQTVTNALKRLIRPGDIVVLAGSLPEDTPPNTYAELVKASAAAEAVVLAARGTEATQLAIKARPSVVILNQNEMEAIFNHPVRTPADIISCGHKLREQGVEQVLVTMMGDQAAPAAILVTGENVWEVEAAAVENGSMDGVEDALLAGFLTAWSKRYSSKQALELGTAAAIYTASHVGSEFGTLEEIQAKVKEAFVAQAGV